MSRVLVTGAAGFIGSHLTEALLRRGDEVTGIDNFDAFYGRNIKEANLHEAMKSPGFAFHELDILDHKAVAALLTADTAIVHLAARPGVRPSLEDPAGYARINVEGTVSLAMAARSAGVSRFIFGSSSSVYGDDTPAPFREDAAALSPMSPYAASKRCGELMLASLAPTFGLRVAALRFFTVYGPRQRPDLAIHAFSARMLRGEPLVLFGDGSQSRDYTYCEDIVAGVTSAIDWTASAPAGVEIFNLGGSRPVPLGDMVKAVSSAVGRSPEIQWAPMQPGDVQHTFADLGKSERILGYRPKVSFQEGLRRFAAWLEERHGR